MKRIQVRMFVWLALFLSVGVLVTNALAQRPEVKLKEGHKSPLTARITYRDGSKRTVTVIGSGFAESMAHSHEFEAVGPGDSEVSLWLDAISTIKEITDREATFVLKSGTERRLK